MGGGLDAVLLGEADHLQAEIVRVVALAHEIVIGDGTPGGMLAPVVVWANRSMPDPGVPESAQKQGRAAVASLPSPGPAAGERTSAVLPPGSSPTRVAAPGGYDLYSVSQKSKKKT